MLAGGFHVLASTTHRQPACVQAHGHPARPGSRLPRLPRPTRAEKWDDYAVNMIDNVLGTGKGAKPQRPPPPRAQPASQPHQTGNGLLLLLLLNYGLFAADKVAHGALMRTLPLHAAKWQWWQLVTHAFYHTDFGHLAGNMFMLWVFGRSLEADEGSAGLVAYYLLCALGSAAAFMVFSPRSVGLGASGAVFGLYVLSIGVRLANFSWRKLVDVAAITPFVLAQISSNVGAQLTGGGALGLNVAYMAHLGGAATGLLLAALQLLLPAEDKAK